MKIDIKCAYTDLVDVAELKPHPKNPNRHPPKQVALLAKLIKRVGMRQPITVSKLSGYIVRGHGRLAACKALKMRKVPVDYQDYEDEAQEMADLMADNRIPEFAELDLAAARANLDEIADSFKLEELGFTVSEFKDVDLQSLLNEEITEDELAQVTAVKGEQDIYKTTIEPTIFPSSNKWGIPDIRLDMIPEDFEVSGIRCNRQDPIQPGMMYLWGSNKFPDDCQRGLCAFYVDDKRYGGIGCDFDANVNVCNFLKAHNFAATIGPNNSLYIDLPYAMNLYNTFQARYVSRLWQEMGMKVIPDINWGDELSWEYCFDGIPENAPIAAVQCRTTNTGTEDSVIVKKIYLRGLNEAIKRLHPRKLLIYGGAIHRKWIEPNVKFGSTVPVWLDSWKMH